MKTQRLNVIREVLTGNPVNSQDELRVAFDEYRKGTFIKQRTEDGGRKTE